MGRLKQLIREAHRRSLWQVLLIYVGSSFAVLQVVGTVSGALRLPDWLEPVALVLLIVGLPIVLATAIVQEGGPGQSTETPTDPAGSDSAAPHVRLLTWRNALGGGVLAFALWGVVAAGWMLAGGGASSGGVAAQSVAVLPFANMSGDPDNEYFSDGITEEILNALAKLPGLRVPARTSSFSFKGVNIPVAAIADSLDVSHILEGSVRRAGERVLITAQLVDAETDTHLWSDTYERDLVDIFAIQREIATSIADQLEISLGVGQSEGLVVAATDNAEAYDLYLRGLEYWDRPGVLRPNFEAAIELFERAVEMDPEFAAARAALSIVHSAMYWPQYGRYDTSPERLARATEQAGEALRLQPDLAVAHLAMGYVHYWGNYELERGLAELEAAQDLAPQDPEIMDARGFVLRRLGRWQEVYALFEEASALDPRDANLFRNLGGISYRLTGRYADAIPALRRALDLAPDQLPWRFELAWSYVYGDGQLDSLRAMLARLPESERPLDRWDLLRFERNGDGLRRAIGTPTTAQRWLYLAYAHQLRGDRPAARIAFDSARVGYERIAAAMAVPAEGRSFRNWDDAVLLAPQLHGLGRAYGGIGDATAARAVADRLLGFVAFDAYLGNGWRVMAARILGQAGLADDAVEVLEDLAAAPLETTAYALRLDPNWDPIREHPRFQALMSERERRERMN